MSPYAIYGGLGAAIAALDRWSKIEVAERLPLHSSKTVVDGFFDIVHTRNTGLAFSLFADSPPLVRNVVLPAVSLAAVVLIVFLFARQPDAGRASTPALTLVLAGAAGNLYDRFAYGYVVDFLDVYVGAYHWPAFNVADSAITVGAALLLIGSFRKPKPAAGETP